MKQSINQSMAGRCIEQQVWKPVTLSLEYWFDLQAIRRLTGVVVSAHWLHLCNFACSAPSSCRPQAAEQAAIRKFCLLCFLGIFGTTWLAFVLLITNKPFW
jgi:hypothetical protein